ncbi:hypothetical protein OG462_43455 [Streptomyces sp. NBC_01077]|uniref:hypothetical protein n=1 Tax=Streptomyces sp. NBC_01077 TaxID=2903746 RepID=UPI00386B57CE|nr:hypothetical protein OG462_01550 [Streptomyces sp. NBC_01077]WSV43629.1 hypothetical protein OG462_43455 [Streptomyces sp. NBC_01077]
MSDADEKNDAPVHGQTLPDGQGKELPDSHPVNALSSGHSMRHEETLLFGFPKDTSMPSAYLELR